MGAVLEVLVISPRAGGLADGLLADADAAKKGLGRGAAENVRGRDVVGRAEGVLETRLNLTALARGRGPVRLEVVHAVDTPDALRASAEAGGVRRVHRGEVEDAREQRH